MRNISALSRFSSFSVPGNEEKVAGLWFLRGGISTHAGTMKQQSFKETSFLSAQT